MRAYFRATLSMAALLVGLSLSVPAAAQTTIFNTSDYRQDRAHWTDPAYFRNNTPGQLRGMALDIESYQDSGQVGSARIYGSEGTGRPGATNLTSPYPYTTAAAHYQAWLDEARGGTKHTKDTLPDWSGRWEGGGDFRGRGPASDIVKLLTPQYQEYYVQELKGVTERRIWSQNAFCLPGGFFSAVNNANEFIVTPNQVWILGIGNGANYIRWIYTDGSGHSPEDFQFPKWHGESVGFWNGDALIIHTNQIRGWKGGVSEFTDNLETVERYRRVGDRIEGEITLYDPEVFVRPVKATLSFDLAREFNSIAIPEYARSLLECQDGQIAKADIARIARGQLALDASLLRQANRIAFSDTDLLTTVIWSEVLFGGCPAWIRAAAADQHFDLTLLLDVDVPFVGDSVRYLPDLPEERRSFFERCKGMLIAHDRCFVEIRGSWEQRGEAARGAVAALIEKPACR